MDLVLRNAFLDFDIDATLNPSCLADFQYVSKGGFALVYIANYRRPDGLVQPVAVKVLKPQHHLKPLNYKKFLQEVAIHTALGHPCLVRALGFCSIPVAKVIAATSLDVLIPKLNVGGGAARKAKAAQDWFAERRLGKCWAMVLELMPDGNLFDQVRAAVESGRGGQPVGQTQGSHSPSGSSGLGCYSDAEALTWMVDVADALAFLHSQQPLLIHRDVKLENILLRREADGRLRAKLSDFGLTAALDSSGQKLALPEVLRAPGQSLQDVMATAGPGLVLGTGPAGQGQAAQTAAVAAQLPFGKWLASKMPLVQPNKQGALPAGANGGQRPMALQQQQPVQGQNGQLALQPPQGRACGGGGGGARGCGDGMEDFRPQRSVRSWTALGPGPWTGLGAPPVPHPGLPTHGSVPDALGGYGGSVNGKGSTAVPPTGPALAPQTVAGAWAGAGAVGGAAAFVGAPGVPGFGPPPPRRVSETNPGQVKLQELNGLLRLGKGHRDYLPDMYQLNFKLTTQCGSVCYMAPEVARQLPYNQKADVFSFGCILYEVATRQLLSDGLVDGDVDGAMEYLSRVAWSGWRPDLPAWLSKDLRLLISLCWHREPRLRPSLPTVATRLREILFASSAPLFTPSLSPPPQQPKQQQQRQLAPPSPPSPQLQQQQPQPQGQKGATTAATTPQQQLIQQQQAQLLQLQQQQRMLQMQHQMMLQQQKLQQQQQQQQQQQKTQQQAVPQVPHSNGGSPWPTLEQQQQMLAMQQHQQQQQLLQQRQQYHQQVGGHLHQQQQQQPHAVSPQQQQQHHHHHQQQHQEQQQRLQLELQKLNGQFAPSARPTAINVGSAPPTTTAATGLAGNSRQNLFPAGGAGGISPVRHGSITASAPVIPATYTTTAKTSMNGGAQPGSPVAGGMTPYAAIAAGRSTANTTMSTATATMHGELLAEFATAAAMVTASGLPSPVVFGGMGGAAGAAGVGVGAMDGSLVATGGTSVGGGGGGGGKGLAASRHSQSESSIAGGGAGVTASAASARSSALRSNATSQAQLATGQPSGMGSAASQGQLKQLPLGQASQGSQAEMLRRVPQPSGQQGCLSLCAIM